MMRVRTQQAGFTLLEILLSTGAFMVVMVVAVSIFAFTVGSASSTEQMRINTQAARYAFESISREVRLAKGLVYVLNEDPKMVISPFAVDEVAGTQRILVYQVKRAAALSPSGEPLYSVNRKVYFRDGTSGALRIELQKGNEAATNKTAQEFYTLVTGGGITWDQTGTDSMLSPNLVADQLKIHTPIIGYPAPNESLNTLIQQPYLRVDLTVENPQYNSSRDENRKVRTTFRTMMVPRSFANPYEVVQPGVQQVAP